MRILITAGNTQTPIDQVRCITNVFTGRTGTRIALTARGRGHAVTLLTSHPEVAEELARGRAFPDAGWEVRPYRSFDELQALMNEAVPGGGYDALVHAAAVSDYRVEGVYTPSPWTYFSAETQRWASESGAPGMVNVREAKVKSRHGELWLRLAPTPKLADRVRGEWGFKGAFVKFKLEAGLGEAELLAVAERARLQSGADWMVANTYEERHSVAYIGSGEGAYRKVTRDELPEVLLDRLER